VTQLTLFSSAHGRAKGARLEALGRFAVRRRRLVLLGAVVFVLLGGAIGGNVVERLSSGGFDDPHSEAVRAATALEKRFGVDVPNLVLLVSSGSSVDDPAVSRSGARLARQLAHERAVERVSSYWTSGPDGRSLRSRDGRSALITAQVAGSEDHVSDRVKELAPHLRGRHGPLRVGVAGTGELLAESEAQVKRDLTKAEIIALPLTLLALFMVFRGLVAAGLPLAIGSISIVGTLLSLRLISELTPVSVFAVNLATALGLGLAIDYSLLMVARFRDELRRGSEPGEAILATMRTAGRTVLFSAVTVAISLAGLLVFPMYYLRSFAYAGVSVVVVAVLGALIVMPALLAVTGRRIDALQLKRRKLQGGSDESGFWYRLAGFTMRRPVPIATAVIALLLVLGLPFLHASMTFSDERSLPESAPARQVGDQIRKDFAQRDGGTMLVLSERAPRGARLAAEVDGYAARLSRVDGVLAVDALGGTYRDGRRVAARHAAARARYADDRGATWLAVESRTDPLSTAGERVAREVRALPAPFPVQTTGIVPRIIDTKDAMASRLPIALALIALTTFVALLALTGSVLAPLKALLMNVLSLTAAFGALVYVFQDGHLQWLVGGFTVTDTINVLNPPLLFCVAFGLSMDYEVFMLSRIKEEHDRGRDTAASVAIGLQRTGPIITAAAAVMAIVFLSIATSSVTIVKTLGVGLALAVLIDATLVRVALVPALMRLAGRFNWWAPDPLRRLQGRLGWVRGEALPGESAGRP
jgi:putative drug exporter of the RND superfamily